MKWNQTGKRLRALLFAIVLLFTATLHGGTMTVHADDSITGPEGTACQHVFVEVSNTPATESTTGMITYKCSICGIVGFEITPKLPHTHTWFSVGVDPTYTSEGSRYDHCRICGESKSTTIPKLTCTAHTWDSGTVTKGAENEEILTQTCTTCGATQTTRPGPAEYGSGIISTSPHTHSFDGGTITKPATEAEAGIRTYTCSTCGRTKTEEIPKLAHTTHAWDGGKVTKPATEAEAGIRTYTCSTCGQTKTETIPKLAHTTHTWDDGKVTKPATETETGIYTYTCTTCGKTKTSIILKLAHTTHTWDDGTVTKPATETAAGEKRYTCTICGVTRTEDIPKTATTCTHSRYTKTQVTVREASATQNGLVRFVCDGCGGTVGEREIHAYQTYTIQIGGGKTETIYGYFDDACAAEIVTQLNAYRAANGRAALTVNPRLQEATLLRAVETSYLFDHARPDGTPCYTAAKGLMFGENIAQGQRGATAVMTAWKNSTSHNATMLDGRFTICGVAAFRRLVFTEGYAFPQEYVYYVQTFGTIR